MDATAIQLDQSSEIEQRRLAFLKASADADKLFDKVQAELTSPSGSVLAFYEQLRKEGCWGEDEKGMYFLHPDGAKEYRVLDRN